MGNNEEDLPKAIPVKAVVRGRPLSTKEIDEGCEICLEFMGKDNQVMLSGNKYFTFDHVFGPDIGQEEVYKTAVKPLTEGIFKGFHATVLAYGQTGSGKTYSMGSAYTSANADAESIGVIPRVLADIFRGVSEKPDRKFTIKVSYLELYKKELKDLLCSQGERPSIAIRDAPDGGTMLAGLTELTVNDIEETLQIMERGNSNRTTAATAMNLVSSRSHAIFTIMVESISHEGTEDKISSKFHLVDLAGSERIKKTKAEGERLQEGIKINEGLLALGNVISALADENLRSGHIKYRDSKLTRILQGSLGGNSHTVMIACVSLADSNHEETLNTLRYADRVRKIKNKPVINRDPQAALIASLKKEIQQLNLILLEKGGGFRPTSSYRPQAGINDASSQKVDKLEEKNAELLEKLDQANTQHAYMWEKIIVTELSRDKLKEVLAEIDSSAEDVLKEYPFLAESEQNFDEIPLVESLKRLIVFLKFILSRKVTDEGSIIESLGNEDGHNSPTGSPTSLEHNAQDQCFSVEHAKKNADLGKQLQELTKTLAMKEEIAKKMHTNNSEITAIREEYEKKILQLDKDIESLTKEKSSLEKTLQQAQKHSESRKISENRRLQIAELEAKIQILLKEKKEKEKLLRIKEENKKSIERLNKEIQDVKRTRVELMKKIKSENEKFNSWKKEKVKEVRKLEEKNRKRNFEYAKLERIHQKQAAIYRRKTEEAAAAIKRLKETMNKQRTAASKRKATENRKMEGAGPKIKSWFEGEVELASRIQEADRHLQLLLEDRKILTQELQRNSDSPSKRRRTFTHDDIPENDRQAELKQEISMKNAQIRQIQEDLAEANDKHPSNSRWTNISTILEGKCALKHALQLILNEKMQVSKLKDKLVESERKREEAESGRKAFSIQMDELSQKHEKDKTILEQNYQEQISVYVSRLSSKSPTLGENMEKLKSMVEEQAEAIEMLKAEKEELHKQLLDKKTKVPTFPSTIFNERQSFFKPLPTNDSFEIESPDDEDYVLTEDDEREYSPTPKKRWKKKSYGIGCQCKKSRKPCGGALCGCVKRGSKCSDLCKCTADRCHNRETSTTADDEEPDTMTENLANTTFNVLGDAEPTSTWSPSYFPTLDQDSKENREPDIIPRTPIDSKKDSYKPVYFNSPLSNKN